MTTKTTMMMALLAGAAACVGAVQNDLGGDNGSGAGAGTASGAGPASGNGTTGSGEPVKGLVAHEWGTYTSVQSSLGTTMEGMAHEDEPLPAFVHGRADTGKGMCNAKQLEFCPKGVTQKLETPVIYFYGEQAGDVRVSVDFPKGIISQWYPNANTFAPAVDPNKVGTPAGGSMSWLFQLDPKLGDADFPPVAATDIWAPSRHVGSVPIQLSVDQKPEQERFIFYRGLGGFDTPFHVTSKDQTTIALHNDSPQAVPAAYLLVVTESYGQVRSLGAVPAKGASEATLLDKQQLPMNVFIGEAKKQVKAGLVASGLTGDEAQAMVDTWERSYFTIPGTRILYVAPRAWTDELLPIHITPEPKELVRTLVGRVEVLTVAEETSIADSIKAYQAGKESEYDVIKKLGRFAEPKLRRGAELVKGSSTLTVAAGELVQYAMEN